MGLTNKSTGVYAFLNDIEEGLTSSDAVIALVGNPNTGKSTVFNGLTGLNQHTGNWPGKTVVLAKGVYEYECRSMLLVDLPGTYSLLINSAEEQVARDFICFGKPDAAVVVTDATCIERNLNLAFQIMELTPKVILCLNLIDEAHRKSLKIDVEKLEELLGVPVVPTSARNKVGLDELKKTIHNVAFGKFKPNPKLVTYNNKLEEAIANLKGDIERLFKGSISSRWLALRLLDGDPGFITEIRNYLDELDT